jgi:hypothetical protein
MKKSLSLRPEPASRQSTGIARRTKFVSEASAVRTARKGAGKTRARNTVLASPDQKWRPSLPPRQTIALDAPMLQVRIHNVGPAVFEVVVEDREGVVLLPGKTAVMPAYSRITVENWDGDPGIAAIEFLPRTPSTRLR